MTARFTALALLLFAAVGCSRSRTPVEAGDQSQTLLVGNGVEPSDLDPQIVTGIPEGNILHALFEPLVQLDTTDLHPVPGAAESWEISSDGLVYRLHLRASAKWSNGDPVTAADWVYSIQRFITPELGAQFSYKAFYLAGAEDYLRKKITDFGQVGVRALDPLTVEFRLHSPTPYFLSVLSDWNMLPVHRPTLEKFGAFAKKDTPWSRAGNMVSNGPFMLKEWKTNQYVSMVPNPHYWDRGVVRLQELRFYAVDSEDAEERMFRGGQIHVTANMPLSKLDVYRANEPKLLRIAPFNGAYFFDINTRRGALGDARVRRALSLAISRRILVEKVSRGGQPPAYVFEPPGLGGYQPGPGLVEDRNEARRLLAEAGFPGGRGFPKLALLFNTSEAHRPICEAVQEMWKQELGIDVTLTNQEWKVYLNSLKVGDYDIARAGWVGNYPDPHEFLAVFRTGGGNNFTGWGNAEYDRILTESEGTATNEVRFPLLQKLDALVASESPVIPLYHYTRTMLMRPSLKGWPSNAGDIRRYKQMWLEPQK